MTWWWPEEINLPGYKVATDPDAAAIEAAAELIVAAEKPVLYVGGGVIKADASAELAAFVEATGIPVTTTLMARGAFPDSHPLHLGMPGMHGKYSAVTAIQRCDLLLAFGSRFDDRVTGKIAAFAPGAKVVHIDIDRAELGKVRRPDVAIASDAKRAIVALTAAILRRAPGGLDSSRIAPWLAECQGWVDRYPFTYDTKGDEIVDGPIKPQFVVEMLRALTPPDCIVVAGVGQHQMWAAQHYGFDLPRTWINSGGLGTMGFAVPAAIGAKVGRPDRMVWGVDGDGCFQMTAQELVTASAERIPVKIAILNNAYLGMVRQWQHMFYEERYSEVYLSPDLPDYVLWAEAMGCVGLRATAPSEVAAVIEKANSIDDRPVVIDFRTDSMEQVFPMVPAGSSNDDIVVHPSQLGQAR
jgi:acetolactate synthase-1/2/3 large subunit